MKRVEMGKMSKIAVAASKKGDATVQVSKGCWLDEDTGEHKEYINFSVIIDGVVGSSETFNGAMETWKEKREEQMSLKVAAAKKLLAQEGA